MFRKMISILAISVLFFNVSAQAAASEKTIEHHPEKVVATTPVNLNSADLKTLTTLKGIGPKKAQAILTYRQTHGRFKTLQEVATVKGIGQKALDRLIKNNPNRLVVGA